MIGAALLAVALLLGAAAGIALGTVGASRLSLARSGAARAARSSVVLLIGGYGGAVLLVAALVVLALTHLTVHAFVVQVPR